MTKSEQSVLRQMISASPGPAILVKNREIEAALKMRRLGLVRVLHHDKYITRVAFPQPNTEARA